MCSYLASASNLGFKPLLMRAFPTELNVRTRLDHHEYLELPAFLLAALMYCFYFSFARVGEQSIHPTSWPLLWLLLVAAVLVNPLPIFARSARYWLLKNCGRLLTSGVRRVEVSRHFLLFATCVLTMKIVRRFLDGVSRSSPPNKILCSWILIAINFAHLSSPCQTSTFWVVYTVMHLVAMSAPSLWTMTIASHTLGLRTGSIVRPPNRVPPCGAYRSSLRCSHSSSVWCRASSAGSIRDWSRISSTFAHFFRTLCICTLTIRHARVASTGLAWFTTQCTTTGVIMV